MTDINSTFAPVKTLDEQLYVLVKGVDILDAIGPLNYKEQRQAFFDARYSVNPAFQYQSRNIDSFASKRALFNLPVESVGDEHLYQLYTGVIESYVDKLDQYRSIGSPEFLYDSLRYYGEPTDKDLSNAHFILHLPDDEDGSEEKVSALQVQSFLEGFAKREGYEYQIKLDDSMIANVLVSGSVVKINSSAQVSATEMQALAHHELGVHLVTTLNARSQPLKVLSLGCPINTMTQEGLAILNEYLAGFMTLSRLKVLALRVLAVHSMINERDFRRTFLLLKEQYDVPDQQAFTITARVYRGGGFTKDFLYLQGFHQMLNAYEQEPNFQQLLSGKVSLSYLPIISGLIDKGYLQAPKLISPAILAPHNNDVIKQFITHAIR